MLEQSFTLRAILITSSGGSTCGLRTAPPPSGVQHPLEENSGIPYLSCEYYLLYWNDWFSSARENIGGLPT
jgi:hypothetical protein